MTEQFRLLPPRDRFAPGPLGDKVYGCISQGVGCEARVQSEEGNISCCQAPANLSVHFKVPGTNDDDFFLVCGEPHAVEVGELIKRSLIDQSTEPTISLNAW